MCQSNSGDRWREKAFSPVCRGKRRTPHPRYRALLALFCCLTLLLPGCQSRPPSGGASQQEEPDFSSPEPETPIGGPEDSSEPEIVYLTDTALIAEAQEMVAELLQRADEAGDFYRGAVLRDDMTAIDREGGGGKYYLVIDERLATYDDLQEHLDKTFIRGGVAADRFEKMRLSQVYISVNGQLHVQEEISLGPLTLGGWDITTLRLIRLDDERIEVQMDATLAGQPIGPQVLSLVSRDGRWLLDDSYFLD